MGPDKSGKSTEDSAFPAWRNKVAAVMCVFMVVFPFISFWHSEPLTELTKKYFGSIGSTEVTDWFLYQKEVCLIVFAQLLGIVMLCSEVFTARKWKDSPLQKAALTLPLTLTGAYALLLILSCIVSEHGELVLMGMIDRYEGLLGVLSYLVVFIAGMNFFCDARSLRYFSNAVLVLSCVVSVLALPEYMGYPLIESDVVANLIAPPEQNKLAKSLISTSSEVKLTFFNSNYFGGFCALMLPVTAAAALDGKSRARKLAGLLASAGVAAGAVFSNSTAGTLAAALGAVLMLVVCVIYRRRKLSARPLPLVKIVCIAAFCAGGLILLLTANGELRTQLREVLTNGGSKYADIAEERKALSKNHYVPSSIRQDGRTLVIEDYSGSSLSIEVFSINDGVRALLFRDRDGALIEPYINDELYYCFKDKRYRSCRFRYSSDSILTVDLGYKAPLCFLFEKGSFKPFLNGRYTAEKINSYKGPAFLKDHLKFATGRGFIWGTAVTMLPDVLILGKGCGSFVDDFPQYDYVSLLEVYGTPAMIVDKPHSWYLGTAMESGVVSLAVLIILLGAFIKRGFVSVVLSPVSDGFMYLRLGIFVSVLAYMLVGLANDSTVCVSPLFWLIFGIGWCMVSGDRVIDT